jgi:hypothetical protein
LHIPDVKRWRDIEITRRKTKQSNDNVLQDQVAAWHIADLDKAIDALGDEAADYDRDGLRAVAHIGGKVGMKKFVQRKGEYNPADELGTSLQSYYDKFSAS